MTELADVFHHHGPSYRAQFGDKMLPRHRQAMRAIERCRTPALGGHIYTCEACGETQYLYHSCRDRHCPKCQNDKAYLWLDKQHDLLLPVPYFMLTVTLPGELRSLARSNQRLVYDLLFRASAGAVQSLAQDARLIGAQLGDAELDTERQRGDERGHHGCLEVFAQGGDHFLEIGQILIGELY